MLMLKHLHVFTATPDLLVLIASKGLECCVWYPCGWFLPAETDVDDGFNLIVSNSQRCQYEDFIYSQLKAEINFNLQAISGSCYLK